MVPEGEEEAYSRDDIIAAFAANPNLPAADQLVIGHISSFLALTLASDGPTHKQAVKLLSMKYDAITASQIWEAWAPHFSLTEDHPLGTGGLAMELVLMHLCRPYNTAKTTREAAKNLVDNLGGSISTQTFLDHTATDDLDEEELEETEVTSSLSCLTISTATYFSVLRTHVLAFYTGITSKGLLSPLGHTPQDLPEERKLTSLVDINTTSLTSRACLRTQRPATQALHALLQVRLWYSLYTHVVPLAARKCNYSLPSDPTKSPLAHSRTPAQPLARASPPHHGHHRSHTAPSPRHLPAIPLTGGGGGAPP
jgi:hypothetical protein